jgi:D-lactate dehydrogenase (cytochrome)
VLNVDRDTPLPSGWPVPRWTEPAGKTAAGYAPPRSLLDLFIGQEGTLGVVTAATVRLTDLHEAVGMLLWFTDRRAAVEAMRSMRQLARDDRAGLVSPRCIEYLDGTCVQLARQRVGDVPDEAGAALFVEQELHHDADDHLAAWWELSTACGALADDTVVAADDASRAQLHALRHAIPAGINEVVVRNGMRKVGTDLAVPDDALDTLLDAYEAAPLEHVLFGHLGDNHLHLNLLPRTPEELQLAKSTYDDLARLAVSLGGTVSAEHGIGKLKREHLSWMVGDDVIAAFARLKRHLDPAWVLGRGNVLHPDL